MAKIGAELPKFSQKNKTGYPFLDNPVQSCQIPNTLPVHLHAQYLTLQTE